MSNLPRTATHELSHDPLVVIEEVTTTTSSTTTDQASESSDVFNYSAALLSEGLFFMNFLDAVSEGDGQRIMRQYKYLMLLCKADDPHSTKYALESLCQLLLVNGLSQKESEIFVWNRTVNNHGGLGNNIPHDLDVEHSNNFNKQGYRNIGANLSEKAVSRICHAEKPVRNISGKVDRRLQRFIRSGKHIQRFPVVDLDVLLKKLNEREVFKYHEGRSYTHIKGFERDALVNRDMSKMYAWLNDHEKKFSSGVKAR